MTYIGYKIETDPEVLAQDGIDNLIAAIPGWQPADGAIEVQVIEAAALLAGYMRDVAADVPDAIMTAFGNLFGYPPLAAISASFLITINVVDSTGYTIPAGTNIGLRDSAGNILVFVTQTDSVIAAGFNSITNVLVKAADPGAYPNALSLANQLSMVDSLAYVTALAPATGYTVAAGGQDAEDTATYLNRLVGIIRLFAPRPIIPADFTAFALMITGVGRALAVDGYDPVAFTTGNDKTIAMFITGLDGLAAGSTIKANVDADLQARREVNFNVVVADPEYTNIDVTASVKALSGYTIATVQAAIVAALQSYLSPLNWGNALIGSNTTWVQRGLVRFNDIVSIIHAVPGVDYISTLTIGKNGGAQAGTDLTLGTHTNTAQLTRPNLISTSTITVT